MLQKRVVNIIVYGFLLALLPVSALRSQPAYLPKDRVAADFKVLLQRPSVDFRPSIQQVSTDSVLVEKGFIYSEATEKIPFILYKPVGAGKAYPVVIILHGTGGNKDEQYIKDMMYQLTRMGMMGVAIDVRYHGERVSGGAHSSKYYADAIIQAWHNKDKAHQQHPFFFDTVYDLWRLTDYLVTRPDVQADRIGMTGVSMGGIETWMAASVDKRIKVAVPIIAVQSFKWSLDNDRWQGRAHTIWAAHEQAAKDLGDSAVNKANVQALWDKLIPGITGEFDCPSMLRLFAPRPLLILSNEKDLNCPLPGARIAYDAAAAEYKSMLLSDRIQMVVSPNEGHRLLPEHVKLTLEWFSKWL